MSNLGDFESYLQIVRSTCLEMFDLADLTDEVNLDQFGINSLTMGRLVGELRRQGLSITMGAAMQEPSVRGLAAAAAAEQPDVSSPSASALIELTPPQHVYFGHYENVDEDVYHIRLVFADHVRADVAGRAFQALFVRHDSLRLEFVRAPSGWRLRFSDQVPEVRIEKVREETVPGLTGERVSVSVASAPLMRIYQIDQPGPLTLHLMVHGLVFDREGAGVFLDDLDQLIRVELEGAATPAEPSQLSSWLGWLSARRADFATATVAQQWLEYGGAAPADVPLDHERGEGRAEDTRVVTTSVAGDDFSRLLAGTGHVAGRSMESTVLAALLYEAARLFDLPRIRCLVSRSSRNPSLGVPDVADCMSWLNHDFPVAVPGQDLDLPFANFRNALAQRLSSPPAHEMSHALLTSSESDDATVREVQRVPRPVMTYIFNGEPDAVSRVRRTFDEVELRFPGRQRPEAPRNVLFQMVAVVEEGELLISIRYSPDFHSEQRVRDWANAAAARLRELH